MEASIEEYRHLYKKKKDGEEFDVFLSYNKEDEDQAKKIHNLLRDNGIASWREGWDIRPGLPWQGERDRWIRNIKNFAVIIGKSGISKWTESVIDALAIESVENGKILIPIFLQNAPLNDNIPFSLRRMTSVDFRKEDSDPFKRLVWGVTGERREKVYRPGILVASLGESPVVVSSMYDLLTEKVGLTIEHVKVLAPEDHEVQLGYNLIKKALSSKVGVEQEKLRFEDADSPSYACWFLHELCKILDAYQRQGETVFLSLAGGRKSMAALTAWVVPFFSCVEKLYYVIDKNEDHFLSASDLSAQSDIEKMQSMFPNHKDLLLVEIPFSHKQQLKRTFLSDLDSLQRWDYEEVDSMITGQVALQEDSPPELYISDLVLKRFREMLHRNLDDARVVRNGLLAMALIHTLQSHKEDSDTAVLKISKKVSAALHYFVGLSVPLRPVFYTLPRDVYSDVDKPVEKVMICLLEPEGVDGYRTLEAVNKSIDFSNRKFFGINALPPVPSPVDSVLIVPLGRFPMVATQLYTLLTEREQHTIHEVILIYPNTEEIATGAELIREVLPEGVKCIPRLIQGLRDIEDAEACNVYQKALEDEIERVRQQYPGDYHIDLALSGGRRGMTAMTIFAAQKTGLHYVYHTLVTHKGTNDRIDEETTIEALIDPSLSEQERQDRLLLDAYREEEEVYPYEYFSLFRVPVFRPEGWDHNHQG